jgi:hypothetical protein
MIKHTVFRRGKGSQSRTFLGPIGDVDITVNGDQMQSFWVANANTDFHAMITNTINAMNTGFPGDWSHVQLSKQTYGGVYGRTFEITASNAETLISSQRRRLAR